jgi:hypothetical protein
MRFWISLSVIVACALIVLASMCHSIMTTQGSLEDAIGFGAFGVGIITAIANWVITIQKEGGGF